MPDPQTVNGSPRAPRISVIVPTLNEQACLAAFDVLNETVLFILEEDKQQKEKTKRRQQLSKAIDAFDASGKL